jgi:adenosylmethionine-8-amino-7-oxononanoate aminotransferase
MSGHTSRRKDYLPYLLNFPHIPPAYCYRCPFGKDYPSCGTYCAYELEKTIKQEGHDSIAAFIAEPIVGNTLGCVVPPPDYFRIIREICDHYDILFIADEVVTGFGRTGKNFGIDHWGVVPDVIIAGKGISSGYAPLGAVIVHEKVFDVFLRSKRSAFFMGYTFSGNPLSCAIGLAAVKYIQKHGLVERSAKIGAYLFDQFSRFIDLPMVGDIRGKGLLLGIELVENKQKKTPLERSQKVVERLTSRAFKKGLIVLSGSGTADGVNGEHIIVAPPLIIEKGQVDDLIAILEETIVETYKTLGA